MPELFTMPEGLLRSGQIELIFFDEIFELLVFLQFLVLQDLLITEYHIYHIPDKRAHPIRHVLGKDFFLPFAGSIAATSNVLLRLLYVM